MTLRYPKIEKGGIPPEQHPAVIEDMWLAQPGAFLVNYQKRKGWKQGYTKSVIENYLRLNGPQVVKTIAEDIGGDAKQVTSILRRYPDVFRAVGHINVVNEGNKGGKFVSRAFVWDLVEAEVTN